MNISHISFLIFMIATLVHFTFPSVGKKAMTIDIFTDSQDGTSDKKMETFLHQNMIRLVLYYSIIVVSQFILNSIYLSNKCSGSMSENIGYALYITIGPWSLIFAVLLVVLHGMPDLKSAFSDVFGYFAVSSKANDILSELLIGDETVHSNLSEDHTEKSNDLEKASDAIIKMIGNKSVLVNQLTPANFMKMWGVVLLPLIKPNIKSNSTELNTLKGKLFDVVVFKDTVGEAMWYIYAGILVISIVSYKLSVKECNPSLASMKADEAKYVNAETEAKKQRDLNNPETHKNN